MAEPIRVLVVAVSYAMRRRLDTLLLSRRFEVVGNVSNVREAVRRGEPDVILVDFPMLRSDPRAIRFLYHTFLGASIIALISGVKEFLINEAVSAGAIGCLPRNDLTPRALYTAITVVHSGMTFRSLAAIETVMAEPSAAHFIPNRHPVEQRLIMPEDLTPRERDVLKYFMQGYSDREVGGQLCVTPQTVLWHLRNIASKWGVRTRDELRAMVQSAE
jgi:DNA-binding NarL/FixJ family response regulator